MPSKSEKQRKLMALALSYKRGEVKDVTDEVKKIADSMSEKKLKEYAKSNKATTKNEKVNEKTQHVKLFEEYETIQDKYDVEDLVKNILLNVIGLNEDKIELLRLDVVNNNECWVEIYDNLRYLERHPFVYLAVSDISLSFDFFQYDKDNNIECNIFSMVDIKGDDEHHRTYLGKVILDSEGNIVERKTEFD